MLYPLSYRGMRNILTNNPDAGRLRSKKKRRDVRKKYIIFLTRNILHILPMYLVYGISVPHSSAGRIPLYTRTPERVRKMVFAGRSIFSAISETDSGEFPLARNIRKTASTSVVRGEM
jgi:hypothetical protein